MFTAEKGGGAAPELFLSLVLCHQLFIILFKELDFHLNNGVKNLH